MGRWGFHRCTHPAHPALLPGSGVKVPELSLPRSPSGWGSGAPQLTEAPGHRPHSYTTDPTSPRSYLAPPRPEEQPEGLAVRMRAGLPAWSCPFSTTRSRDPRPTGAALPSRVRMGRPLVELLAHGCWKSCSSLPRPFWLQT
ncbi:hypothetical protein KIL84_003148 [Mauremys mutica]|uniref:Uncharacterized protein n=1 Tax=Mauremys mutica TaxID=74926 RepID=A0A9D3WVK0_9SAUR|nr:hypothetical protein KIL84_003148 [Mauremys mutica]